MLDENKYGSKVIKTEKSGTIKGFTGSDVVRTLTDKDAAIRLLEQRISELESQLAEKDEDMAEFSDWYHEYKTKSKNKDDRTARELITCWRTNRKK